MKHKNSCANFLLHPITGKGVYERIAWQWCLLTSRFSHTHKAAVFSPNGPLAGLRSETLLYGTHPLTSCFLQIANQITRLLIIDSVMYRNRRLRKHTVSTESTVASDSPRPDHRGILHKLHLSSQQQRSSHQILCTLVSSPISEIPPSQPQIPYSTERRRSLILEHPGASSPAFRILYMLCSTQDWDPRCWDRSPRKCRD